ncbi:unnamed protein product [Bursaphelenchus okinawaensis]|uniref:AD domain-containing protein n=1 Tax=Bursaphelenchus okinawaensis TaxID=465554 RepID=A0A811LQ26_9BILA|nr:unnamed protein product [Bursaphelenchus okinawaensis]CAG9125951.1 unnamed protein product [Bursaphelenchus okinawaensis]
MARLSDEASRTTIKFGKSTLPKGARVEVTMKDGSTFTGQTVLYDSAVDWFVLMEDKGQFYEKLLINYEFVDQGTDEELMQEAESRLAKALEQKKYYCSDQASQKAVKTFMKLKQILTSVEWANNDIVVMDTVRIVAPFEQDNCETISKSRQADDCLARVKKILAHLNETTGQD